MTSLTESDTIEELCESHGLDTILRQIRDWAEDKSIRLTALNHESQLAGRYRRAALTIGTAQYNVSKLDLD